MNYKKSVELALSLGYDEIADENAYRGTYYIDKEGKIWIHNIDALKKSLGGASEENLEQRGYDVGTYHYYKDYTNEMSDNVMMSLYAELSPFNGEPAYLSDGMYLYQDVSIGELTFPQH